MLQIVPSKSNEERLLLVSPEPAGVLATIITRLRRLVEPPLPHLFQHTRNGWTWKVPAGICTETTEYAKRGVRSRLARQEERRRNGAPSNHLQQQRYPQLQQKRSSSA